jgi:predicted phosphoadenosine phosphosulfate sulfurtransferase
MGKRLREYICKWKNQGYSNGIPDEVPIVLMRNNLAPSYKAIALSILKNNHNLALLGFSGKKSIWYDVLKKEELIKKGKIKEDNQLYFNFGVRYENI